MNEEKFKATIRIPTEQYAYVEFHVEDTPEDVAHLNHRLMQLFTGGIGLQEPEFQRVLDRYLWGDGSMLSEEYEGMSKEQQNIIQNIKRSKKRKAYENAKKD
jgi:hypothetical protein